MVIPVPIDDAVRLIDRQLRGMEATLANLLKLQHSIQYTRGAAAEGAELTIRCVRRQEHVQEVAGFPNRMEHSVGVVRFVHGRVKGHTETAKAVLRDHMKGLSRMVSSYVHGHFSY